MRIYVTGRDVTKTSAPNSTHLVRPDIGYQTLKLTGNYVFFYLYMLLFYCKKIILLCFDKKLHVHRNKKKKPDCICRKLLNNLRCAVLHYCLTLQRLESWVCFCLILGKGGLDHQSCWKLWDKCCSQLVCRIRNSLQRRKRYVLCSLAHKTEYWTFGLSLSPLSRDNRVMCIKWVLDVQLTAEETTANLVKLLTPVSCVHCVIHISTFWFFSSCDAEFIQ